LEQNSHGKPILWRDLWLDVSEQVRLVSSVGNLIEALKDAAQSSTRPVGVH